MALDVASNGNFMSRYLDDAIMLIESLASNISNNTAYITRKTQAQTVDNKQVALLSAKIDFLLNNQHVKYGANVDNSNASEKLGQTEVLKVSELAINRDTEATTRNLHFRHRFSELQALLKITLLQPKPPSTRNH